MYPVFIEGKPTTEENLRKGMKGTLVERPTENTPGKIETQFCKVVYSCELSKQVRFYRKNGVTYMTTNSQVKSVPSQEVVVFTDGTWGYASNISNNDGP